MSVQFLNIFRAREYLISMSNCEIFREKEPFVRPLLEEGHLFPNAPQSSRIDVYSIFRRTSQKHFSSSICETRCDVCPGVHLAVHCARKRRWLKQKTWEKKKPSLTHFLSYQSSRGVFRGRPEADRISDENWRKITIFLPYIRIILNASGKFCRYTIYT